MNARLPLRLHILQLVQNAAGTVECDYELFDADDNRLMSSSFTTAAAEVDQVGRDLVERMSAQFAAAPKTGMSDDARASLDQIISAPGIARAAAPKKTVTQ